MFCTEGMACKDHIPVLTHTMDIPVRLKEVNRDFFIMLNTKSQKFEIHCKSQPYDTLACVLPFDTLDERTIEYARKYSSARTEIITREIDEFNERLNKKKQQETIDKANYKMKEAYNYLKNNRTTDHIPEEVIAE